ncbi:MAG: phosphoribosylglycinamide formyltransferase [Gemmatimonadales bacterium]
MKARIAVLASGNGSNLQAILDHFAALGDAACGEVTLIASNRSGAGALDRARAAGVDALVFDARSEDDLSRIVTGRDIQIIALAGYLRLVPRGVIEKFRGRIVNVHPGPLPRFGGPGMYGVRVHEAVIAAGLKETAVTVHLVTEQYDAGPPLAMWPVPVLDSDTPDTLAQRVLRVEHIIFPRSLDALAATVIQRADAHRTTQ